VTGMDLKLSHRFIPVDDKEKALAFYRDVPARPGGRPGRPGRQSGRGVRDCAFRDPAGNPLRFSQPIAG